MASESGFIESSYEAFLGDLKALVSIDCGSPTKTAWTARAPG